MFNAHRLVGLLPRRMRSQVESYFEALEIFAEVRDPRVLRALGPAGVRGLILQRGKQGVPTRIPASHSAHFDWDYPHDFPEMAALYRRAKQGQWDGETALPWHTSVDPLNPEVPLLPASFLDPGHMARLGVTLSEAEFVKLRYSLCAWMLSQF